MGEYARRVGCARPWGHGPAAGMSLARVASEQEIFEIFHETCNNSRLPFVSKGERKIFPKICLRSE